MRFRLLLLFALGAAPTLAACASSPAPTRNYSVRGPAAYYGAAQAGTAKEWMQKRGIRDEVSYGAETISFKYGNDETRTMDYKAFDSFVTTRLAGQTVANLQRTNLVSSDSAVPATVIYFDPNGRFAQWRGNMVQGGRWWLEGMPELEKEKARRLGVTPPERVICFQAETKEAVARPIGLPGCSPAYDQLVGIHGKQPGDVFNLMSGKTPGTLSPDYPKTWPDGQPLFPERAPHD